MLYSRIPPHLYSASQATPLLVFYAPHVAHCPLQVPKAYYDKFDFMGDDGASSTRILG